jgi:hypothetical protein
MGKGLVPLVPSSTVCEMGYSRFNKNIFFLEFLTPAHEVLSPVMEICLAVAEVIASMSEPTQLFV